MEGWEKEAMREGEGEKRGGGTNTIIPHDPRGMVHAWVGQNLLKNYIFKRFLMS
jgi:hypothetical protein